MDREREKKTDYKNKYTGMDKTSNGDKDNNTVWPNGDERSHGGNSRDDNSGQKLRHLMLSF